MRINLSHEGTRHPIDVRAEILATIGKLPSDVQHFCQQVNFFAFDNATAVSHTGPAPKGNKYKMIVLGPHWFQSPKEYREHVIAHEIVHLILHDDPGSELVPDEFTETMCDAFAEHWLESNQEAAA